MSTKPKRMPYHRVVRVTGSVRQSVLSGRVDSAGNQNYLVPGSTFNPILYASRQDPLIVSFARGFTVSGRPDDALGILMQNLTWDLWGSTTNWLYVTLDPVSSVVTSGSTEVAPVTGATEPVTKIEDLHWFDTTTMRMQRWDGTAWVPVLRVFLGRAVIGISALTTLDVYPVRQRWDNSVLETQTIDQWSPLYKQRLTGDRLRLSQAQDRAHSPTLVPAHQPEEAGGHLASHIVSDLADYPTAETLITEIRQGRGAYPTLPERVANLTGGFFTRSWSSGQELAQTQTQQRTRVSAERLELDLERLRRTEFRYGHDDRSWLSETGSEYTVNWESDSQQPPTSAGWAYTAAGSVPFALTLEPDPLDATRTVYAMRSPAGFASSATWTVASDWLYEEDPVILEFEAIVAYAPYPVAMRISDGSRRLTLELTETGPRVNGVTYSGGTWKNTAHLFRLEKCYDREWRVFMDDTLLVALPYTTLPTTTTPALELIVSDPTGGNGIEFYLRSLYYSLDRTDARLSQNISYLLADNHLTMLPGKMGAYYSTHPVDLNLPASVQAQYAQLDVTTDHPELVQVLFRSAATRADLAQQAWSFVPAGADNLWDLAPMNAAWGQFRLAMRGEGTVQAAGTETWVGNLTGGDATLRNCTEAAGVIQYVTSPDAALTNADFRAEAKWAGWTLTGNGTTLYPNGVLAPDQSRYVPRLVGDYATASTIVSDPFQAPSYLDVTYRTSTPQGKLTNAYLEVLSGGTTIVTYTLPASGTFTKRLHIPKAYRGQDIQLQVRVLAHYVTHYVAHGDEHAGGEHDDPTYAPFNVDLIETTLSSNYYESPAQLMGGSSYLTLRWKQTVTATQALPADQYPILWVSASDVVSETHYLNRTPVPVQVTALGQEIACEATLFVPDGQYLRVGADYGPAGGTERIIELRDFEVDWQDVLVTQQPIIESAQLAYDQYLFYPSGEAVYGLDSGFLGTKWGHFMAEGGLPILAQNADQKWERRIIKAATSRYLSPDVFEPYRADLVTSPSAVTGFVDNTAFLFTTYLYNANGAPLTLQVPVTSNALNSWELFRNRSSLGRNKTTYTVTIPARGWIRLELFYRHAAGASVAFSTDVTWPSLVSLMSSTRDRLTPKTMFQFRCGDQLPLTGDWQNTGNDRSLNAVGRYAQVRINLTATADRLTSNGTVLFGLSYIPDVVKLARMTMTNVSENLARTNFELKTYTLADDLNLLHILQDVYETLDDIAVGSTNWQWDAGAQQVQQADGTQPASVVSNVFEMPYVPGYAVVVVDEGTPGGQYAVSRDGGVTWQPCLPGIYTELTSGAGVQLVFRAVLTGGATLKRWAVVL